MVRAWPTRLCPTSEHLLHGLRQPRMMLQNTLQNSQRRAWCRRRWVIFEGYFAMQYRLGSRLCHILHTLCFLLLPLYLFFFILTVPRSSYLSNQKNLSFNLDWCNPPRQPRSCPGKERNRSKNLASFESKRPCTNTSWGLVPFDQEGRVYAKALGEKP